MHFSSDELCLICFTYPPQLIWVSRTDTKRKEKKEIENYTKKITSKKETIVSSVLYVFLHHHTSIVEEVIQQQQK